MTPEDLIIQDQRREIAELKRQLENRWISVDDRLPEIGVPVLVLNKWGHINDRILKRLGNGGLFFTPDGLRPGKDVTHWMPLPEPPRVVNDEI